MAHKLIKIALVLAVFGACKPDKLDFGVVENGSISPDLAVPVIKTRIELGDIINGDSDSTLVINPDNSISVVFRDDSIISISADELITINDQTVLSETFEVGELTVGPFSSFGNVTLDQILDNVNPPDLGDSVRARDNSVDYFPPIAEQSAGSYAEQSFNDFNVVYIKEGTMNLTIVNGLPVPLENLELAVRNKEDSSAVFTVSVPSIGPQSTASPTIDLTGAKLTNQVFVDLQNFGTPGSGPDPFDSSKHVFISVADQIAFQMSVDEMVIDSGEVVLPDQAIEDLGDTTVIDNGNNEEIEIIRLKSGSLNYSINSSFQEDIQITFTLPTVSNGTPFNEVITIQAGTVITGGIDLAGYQINLDQIPSAPYNRLPLSVDVEINSTGGFVSFTSQDQIQLDVGVENLEYEYLQGYFGQQVLETDSFTTLVDFSFIQELEGDFRFFSPQFRMRVASEIGLPSTLLMDVTGYNRTKGQEADMNAPLLVVPYPELSQAGQTIVDTLEINNTNSNIVDFMSLVPDSIVGTGVFTTNPNGNTGASNFTYNDSKVDIGLEVEVPLEVAVDGLILEDSSGIDWAIGDTANGGFDASAIERAQLNFNIENGFPLSATLQLILEDTTNGFVEVLDTLVLDVLQGAAVDAEGRVITPNVFIDRLILEGEALQDFLMADRIRARATINTTGSDVPTKVKLFTDYYIELVLSARFELTVNLGGNE